MWGGTSKNPRILQTSFIETPDLKLIPQDWSEINPLYRRSKKKPKRSSFEPIDTDDDDEHGDIGKMAGDIADKDGGFSYNGDIGDVAKRRSVVFRGSSNS